MKEENKRKLCETYEGYLDNVAVKELTEQAEVAMETGSDEEWSKFWAGLYQLNSLLDVLDKLKCEVK